MLSFTPHLVRSALICLTSLIPENGRIADVVFLSSLQVVVGVCVFLLYAIGQALVRVLCSREAVSDPAFEQYDTEAESFAPEPHEPPVGKITKVRRALRTKLQKLSSRLLLQDRPVLFARASSLPDLFSSSDEEGNTQNRQPVGVAFGRPLYGDIANGVRPQRAAKVGTTVRTVAFPSRTDTAPQDCEHSVAPSLAPSAAPSTTSNEKERNVFIEVYGMGLAIFVFFYAIDGSNMQPTLCLLVGILVLAARDTARVTDPEIELASPEAPVLRALAVVAFLLSLTAQCCLAIGVARTPSYHAAMRDGSVLRIPAPATVVDTLLAIVFPLAAPLILGLGLGAQKKVTCLQSLVRHALPTTCIAALWFLSALGAMDAEIRSTLGLAHVNQTITDVITGAKVQTPVVFLAPLVKIPAVLAAIACCISGKSLDVLAIISLVFFAKQKGLVQDDNIRDMLVVGTVLSSCAWALCSLRYCRFVISSVVQWFGRMRSPPET